MPVDAEGNPIAKRNPLNDEHYDGNDDQIDDLKDLVRDCRGTFQNILDDCMSAPNHNVLIERVKATCRTMVKQLGEE